MASGMTETIRHCAQTALISIPSRVGISFWMTKSIIIQTPEDEGSLKRLAICDSIHCYPTSLQLYRVTGYEANAGNGV